LIANVYIDGFNLYYGCLKGTLYKWLDPRALAHRLLPTHEIHRIRYFTAKVVDRPRKLGSAQRQATYLRALSTVPGVTIHLGHFLTSRVRMPLAEPPAGGPNTVAVIRTEEKGSDVNLATYLLADAFRHDCELQLVITNDSDLREPIRLVKEELGMTVGVANPHPAHRRSLVLQPTFFRQIWQKVLVTCQLPPVIKDSQGVFSRPTTWDR
jgi:NYN domain